MTASALTARETGAAGRRVGVLLFAAMFASQASLIAITPSLEQTAAELGVSTATAGQLRTVSGLAAAVAAVLAARFAATLGLRRMLAGGCAVLAFAAGLSAVAPSFTVLAVAQAFVGIGVAAVVGTAGAAAAAWVAPEERTRTLSWALNGQAGAWVVGMPIIATVSSASWRYAWLALPLVAALLAAVAVARGGRRGTHEETPVGVREALRDRAIRRWASAELLANAAWTGVLVFAGALFTQTYGTNVVITGLLLAMAGGSYIAGNLVARRFVGSDGTQAAVAFGLALAVVTVMLGGLRVSPAVTASLLVASAFLAGGRNLAAVSFALRVAPERRVSVNGLRVITNQVGYLVGAGLGGVALALGGCTALGVLLGGLFAGAGVWWAGGVCRTPGLQRLSVCTRTGCA
jgi:predicted MFS family arabinose efflux permease